MCFVVDQTCSVSVSELAVIVNGGNNSSPWTTCVTSQSAAGGVCV